VDDDVISELAPRSPLRLLEDLAQLAHGFAAIGRPRPEVELHLAGGSLVKGRLAAVGRGDDRSGPIAVVIVGGSQRAPAAAYVRIDHVAAVTVGDAAIVVRAPVPVPSRLELERQIAVRSEPLARQLGYPLEVRLASELDDDSRRAIAALVPVLYDVLGGIAEDRLGRLALGAIAIVEIGAAPLPELWKEPPDRLVLRAPRTTAEAFTALTLRPALENLL